MTRLLSNFLMLFAVLVLVACGGESDDKPHDNDAGKHADDGDADADEHADGDDAGKHDDEGDHDDTHGTKMDRGTKHAGPAKVKLSQFGKVLAGFEAVLDIEVTGVKAEALRVWVGVESAQGSMKSKLDEEDGLFHGHVDVPTKLPDGSAIWIEVQAANNVRHRVAFPIVD